METTFPAKLQLLTLQLQQKFNSNLQCSVSLMKGMQHFGSIKIKINKQQTVYNFQEQKIIDFSYTIRLTTRRDVFFRIILNDLEENQQIGDIAISSQMLAECFQEDANAVIQKKQQFVDGLTLRYKIYQPSINILNDPTKISFKNIQKNDFISNLFSHPETDKMQSLHSSKASKKKPMLNSLTKSKISIKMTESGMHSNKNINPSTEQQYKQKQKQNPTISQVNEKPKPDENKQAQIPQVDTLKNEAIHSEQLLSRIFRFTRQSGMIDMKKKHTLSSSPSGSQHSHHDGHHGLSKKLKTVIFLLIFGVIILFVDTLQDRESGTVRKNGKKLRGKKNKEKLH